MKDKILFLNMFSMYTPPEPEENLGVEYWRQLCERFGIKEYRHVEAYGLDIEPEKSGEIMKAACDKARELAKVF